MNPHIPIQIAVALLAAVVLSTAGCAADDFEAAPAGDAPAEFDDQFREAEQRLATHRVDEARDKYARILRDYPDSGEAAAGLGFTELLLLAEMNEVTDLLIDHLGANRGVDANSLLFAEEGYLYWASRGVRWREDDEQYDGIRTLLADEIPWDEERLDSLVAFVDGLDQPVDQTLRQLITVANALSGIDHAFKTALEDPEFVRLYVPGEVFHDSRLTLRLGRSELALFRAGIALFRSAVYFIAAYEQAWNLEEAFGEWRQTVALDDERYVEGFEAIDYTFDYLDDHLFRDINASDRLAASRSALREAISHSRDAIRSGLERRSSTTLQWDAVEEETAMAMDHFLEALGDSLDGPTSIPFSEPATTVDLSVFFDEGRVLDEEIDWFLETPVEQSDSDGGELEEVEWPRWAINDEAVDAFFFDGVFEPTPEENNGPTVKLGVAGTPEDVVSVLFGPYRSKLEEVYFATR